MRHVVGEDIFEVVGVENEDKTTTWKLRFISGGAFLEDAQFKNKQSAEWEADRWVRRHENDQRVHDRIFEMEVLEARTGIDPVSPD